LFSIGVELKTVRTVCSFSTNRTVWQERALRKRLRIACKAF